SSAAASRPSCWSDDRRTRLRFPCKMAISTPITDRQRRILRLVVEQYVTTGQPVGSKGLVERGELGVSPSTVRNEFATLESLGLLMHPHTSAGRVPTERGYRLYAGTVLD